MVRGTNASYVFPTCSFRVQGLGFYPLRSHCFEKPPRCWGMGAPEGLNARWVSGQLSLGCLLRLLSQYEG